MSEVKPVTFRLDSSTTEKFKELASTLGLTQDKMLVDLISAYELEQAKHTLSDRGKEIEEFQNIAHRMIRIYTNSLELNQNSEERIREKFAEQLKQKQDLIINLQEQVNKLKEELKGKDTLLASTLDDNNKFKGELDNVKSVLEIKETLVKEYISKIDTLSSLVTEYSIYKDSIDDVKVELEVEKKTNDALTYEIRKLGLENDSLIKETEVLKERIVEYKDTIKTINVEHRKDIAELKLERDNIVTDNRKITEDLQSKHSKELNDLKSSYNKEVKEIEKRLHEKTQMEIDKVMIKYEKLLLEGTAKVADRDNKNDKNK